MNIPEIDPNTLTTYKSLLYDRPQRQIGLSSTAIQGQTGSQGIQGSVGIQGPVGAVGPAGSQGAQGLQGFANGSIGSQGAQGPQGIQGLPGAQGGIGTPGIQGNQGTQGPQGATGTAYNANEDPIFIGYQAGYVNPGAKTVAIGYQAGYSNSNVGAVAVGHRAGYSASTDISIGARTGNRTSGMIIGADAGLGVSSTVWQNVVIGYRAAETIADHGDIVAIGAYAGNSYSAVDTDGNLALAIGAYAGQTRQGIHSIAIGYKAGNVDQHTRSMVFNATGIPLNSVAASSLVIKPIRNINGTSARRLYYNSSSEISWGAETSSIRYKKNVYTMPDYFSAKLEQLRPVGYIDKISNLAQYGLIAEEVVQLYPEIGVYPYPARLESIEYDKLVAPLIQYATFYRKKYDELETNYSLLINRLQHLKSVA